MYVIRMSLNLGGEEIYKLGGVYKKGLDLK